MEPCRPWATLDQMSGPCAPADPDAEPPVAGLDPGELELALARATEIVWALSGRQFGVCTVRVRPCDLPGRCSHRRRGCRCGIVSELDVGLRPLVDAQVTVDGEPLPSDAWRIDDGRWLVRLDGDPWPRCQDMAVEDDEAGSFVVDATYGVEPPLSGVGAVMALACQLAMSRDPSRSSECVLPKRVTSVTRQGLTVLALDPFEFLDQGRTGVYEVDQFLAAFNPDGVAAPPRIVTPDTYRRRFRRVRTGPPVPPV